jgi:hypothetical protein
MGHFWGIFLAHSLAIFVLAIYLFYHALTNKNRYQEIGQKGAKKVGQKRDQKNDPKMAKMSILRQLLEGL